MPDICVGMLFIKDYGNLPNMDYIVQLDLLLFYVLDSCFKKAKFRRCFHYNVFSLASCDVTLVGVAWRRVWINVFIVVIGLCCKHAQIRNYLPLLHGNAFAND